MKHLILGRGNLGLDLELALKDAKQDVQILSKSKGFNYPLDSVSFLKDYYAPNVVWVALGSGSVAACKENFSEAVNLHVNLIADLIKALPNTKIITFSSNFAADETIEGTLQSNDRPKSLYALSKIWLEQYARFINNPNLKVIRVSALYGTHFPEKTFIGKLYKNYKQNNCISINETKPTPTNELAKKLVENFDNIISSNYPILEAAPKGGTSYLNWAKDFLPNEIFCGKIDIEIPSNCSLGSFFEWESWETLWQKNKINLAKSLQALEEKK